MPTCENACGKLRSMRLLDGSYSSANRPTSLHSPNRRRYSFSASARHAIAERERHRLALGHREFGDGLEILAVMVRWRAQHRHVGPGDRAQCVVVEPRHPRHAQAEIEAHDQLHAHRHLAVLALDDAHEVRDRARIGMKSTAVAALPSDISKRVSRINVPSRYRRVMRRGSAAGAMRQRPWSGVPSSAAKQAAESNRGQHSQSIEPSRPTRAAVSQSPIRA